MEKKECADCCGWAEEGKDRCAYHLGKPDLSTNDQLIRDLLTFRSWTAMTYQIEDILTFTDLNIKQAELLPSVLHSNDLDIRYALIHEYFGETDKAAHLRKWVELRALRQKESLPF